MSNNSENKRVESNNPFDIFIGGARRGFTVAVQNLIPNIVMAYTLAYILKVLGIMDFLGGTFGPVMAIFGLPGEAVTVLLAAWLSSSAGVGIVASLLGAGVIDATQATILLPACYLMGSQLQYMGRLLGVADVPKKYWPLLMLISIINACLAMLIMRIFV